MIKLKLAVWADKGVLAKLKDLAYAWFIKVQLWLEAVLALRFDELSCPVFILNLLAYERDIERFYDEPLALYRKRVKYAFINAKEAGTVQGLKNIFIRLDLGEIEVIERDPAKPWDVITIQLEPSQISSNEELLRVILEKYGRSCRRYEFETITTIPIEIGAAAYQVNYTTSICPEVTL